MKVIDFDIERIIDTTDIEDNIWENTQAEICNKDSNGEIIEEYYSVAQVDAMLREFKEKYNQRLNKALTNAASELLFKLKFGLVCEFKNLKYNINY